VRLNFVFFTESVSELYGQRVYIWNNGHEYGSLHNTVELIKPGQKVKKFVSCEKFIHPTFVPKEPPESLANSSRP
jgi:sporulation protein YlmC with PRC-barrel domain